MAQVITQESMRVGPKLKREYIEIKYTHADLTEEDGSQALVLPQIPSNATPVAARFMVTEYITGGTISAATLALGTAASVVSLGNAINVFDTTDLATWKYTTSTNQTSGFGGQGVDVSPVQCRINTTGDDVDNADAGEWYIGYWYDVVED